MGTQLNAVKDFCSEGFKNGKLIPLTFKFPSFSITEEMYRETSIEVVAERVRLGIDSGTYGHALMRDVSYDDFVEAQQARDENKATKIQEGQVTFIDKILPVQMKKDENMDFLEINRKILAELCDSRLKYSIANIESYSSPFDTEYSSAMVTKDKFVATMIMLKEQIPTAHRQIKLSLRNHPNKRLMEELNGMEQSPDISIVKHIFDIDPKFAEKLFSKEVKTLKDGDKALAEIEKTYGKTI